MRRFFLILLFAVLLLSEMFGWKLGLWQGFSVKNGFLYAFLLVIVIERLVGSAQRDSSLMNFHLPFVILILIAALSWTITDVKALLPDYSRENRLIAIKSLLADLYFFFLAYYYGARSINDAVALAKAILILVFLANVVTVIDVYDIPDLGIIRQMESESIANKGRLMGPIGEPNQYAAFLALFLPSYITLALGDSRRSVRRIMFLAASLATLISLILTGSRGGVLGLIVGTAWGYWLVRHTVRFKKAFKALVVAIPVVVAGVGIAALTFGSLLLGRLDATTEAGSASAATAGRTWIWETGLGVMSDHPLSFLTGMGWHTFAAYVGVVPHNNYLWYFFNLGAIGLMFYLLILRNVIKIARQSMCYAVADSGALLVGFLFGFTALLAAVFFVDLFAPWYFVWAYVGVIMRLAVEVNAEVRELKRSSAGDFAPVGCRVPGLYH